MTTLGDERRPLEHGDVLLDRGEADRVPPGERRDGVLALQRAQHDVPPRGVGEGVEDAVDRAGWSIYNHLVVC